MALQVFSGSSQFGVQMATFSMAALAMSAAGASADQFHLDYYNPEAEKIKRIFGQLEFSDEQENKSTFRRVFNLLGYNLNDESIKKIPLLQKNWNPWIKTFLEDVSTTFNRHSNWLVSCEQEGSEICLKKLSPSSRDMELKVLAYKIENILPMNATQSSSSSIKDCFSSENCSDIEMENIHPRAKKAANVVYTSKSVNSTREHLTNWISSKFVPPEWKDVQEILRFRSDDPREKFLFISTEADHNGALNPSIISTILSKLSQKFDLKFQVVKTRDEICNSVENGKKTGNLAHVLINGHGSYNQIIIDAEYFSYNGIVYQHTKDKISSKTDFAKCFSGVQPNGKIILLSCSTGKSENNNPFDNIAQKIADGAKRVVVAPTHDAYPALTDFLSIDDAVLYHPESRLYSFLPFYNTNLFTSFRPNFKKCSVNIAKKTLHQRETSVVDIIKTDLIAKSLLHKNEPVERAKEYLQLCEEDPRDKVLVLSANYDKNGALEPSLSSKFLSVFADKFDLLYKVVTSLDEICQEVEQAAKIGKVITLVIQAHGTPTEGMILSKDSNENENRITASDDFSQCFSKIDKKGTIVLIGSSLGQNGEHKDNIAQKIADDSKKTVLATTCPIYPSDTTIQSVDPLMLKHSGYPSIRNFLFDRCPENNENHFKTFNPQQKTKNNIHEEF